MHDLSVALRSRGSCSALSSGLITIAAAVSIAALPGFSAASFVNAQYGLAWALLKATTEEKGLPVQVSIGMFRVCYASPGSSCLAFQWGLSISDVSFQGANKWADILPPVMATKAWPVLAAVSFFVTFVGAFVHCMSNAPTFTLFVGILTVALDLAYLAFTAYLFFSMRAQIIASTKYTPSLVLVSATMLGISLGLVLLVGFLTLFVKKEGDHVEVFSFGSEKEGAEGKGSDPEKSGDALNEGKEEKPEPEINPYHGEVDKDAFEHVLDLRAYRLEIKDQECMEEFTTAQIQIEFINNPNYDITTRPNYRAYNLIGAWLQNWRRRHRDAPPNPHEEVYVPPGQ
ncbi:hypothetical protein P389DRAFT_20593 [Cystobasidium minutum MCA 4210]|uniref:uncharacterized protein n=1 Tax=Cystobasidium minutum MCA 4210 TaxID=1397322 RepID=UPI0034CF639A|eukprot:jgi/Rhomi1/20593/CE20592_193